MADKQQTQASQRNTQRLEPDAGGVSGPASSGTDEMGSNIQGTNEISDQIGGKAAHDLTDMQERARGAVPGVPPLESRKARP